MQLLQQSKPNVFITVNSMPVVLIIQAPFQKQPKK